MKDAVLRRIYKKRKMLFLQKATYNMSWNNIIFDNLLTSEAKSTPQVSRAYNRVPGGLGYLYTLNPRRHPQTEDSLPYVTTLTVT